MQESIIVISINIYIVMICAESITPIFCVGADVIN